MFLDKVNRITTLKNNKINSDSCLEIYRNIMKIKLIWAALTTGKLSCCMWLPATVNIEKFNKLIEEDGLDCIILRDSIRMQLIRNNKHRIYVSEKSKSKHQLKKL